MGLIYYNGAYVPALVGLINIDNNFGIYQPNYLQASNNLSDLTNVSLAKDNLGIDPSEAVWNANKIDGTVVDNTDKADGKVLAYDQSSGKIVWSTPSSGGDRTATVTSADSGITLPTDVDSFFVVVNFGNFYSVDLPDVSVMTGRELTFVNVINAAESSFSVNGPVHGGSSYHLSGFASVKLLSDGTSWWITATFENS